MKKFLKIAGIILAVLVLGFFAAGLITPKVSYDGSVTVNKPLEETFLLFNDLDNLKNWIPEVTSYEILSETPDKVGSKIKMTIESEGKTMEMNETILEYVPNEKVGLYFEVGDMKKTDNYHFKADGENTIIHSAHICEGSNLFFKSMFSFFKSYFKKIDQDYLNNFKTFAEKTS